MRFDFFLTVISRVAGDIVLHKLCHRKVILRNGIAIKRGQLATLNEATALGVAVPAVHHVDQASAGVRQIHMDYIKGQSLDKVWAHMPAAQRSSIARELRVILETMRAVPPPPNFNGNCDQTEVRNWRPTSLSVVRHAATRRLSTSSCSASYPRFVNQRCARHWQNDLRVKPSTVSCCPTATSRLETSWCTMGNITGIIDWEEAGWYPKYWEFVKFFRQFTLSGWADLAAEIGPQMYWDELKIHTILADQLDPN